MSTDPMPHLLEIKSQLGSIEAQLVHINSQLPDHGERISSLEHVNTARTAKASFAGALAGGAVGFITFLIGLLQRHTP